MRRFRAALADYKNAEPAAAKRVADAVSVEGCILGRFVIDVLERMPDEPSREAFLEAALAPSPVIIDDWVIAFDEGSNVGSDYVRLVDLGFMSTTSGQNEGVFHRLAVITIVAGIMLPVLFF